MGIRFALGAALLLIFSATPAQARSGALWAERQAGTAPLAQVPDFSSLAAQVVPGVVSIAVEQRAMSSNHSRRGIQDPFEYFHRFETG